MRAAAVEHEPQQRARTAPRERPAFARAGQGCMAQSTVAETANVVTMSRLK
jgi:hypothetical protein